jgi:hypothetical protein
MTGAATRKGRATGVQADRDPETVRGARVQPGEGKSLMIPMRAGEIAWADNIPYRVSARYWVIFRGKLLIERSLLGLREAGFLQSS